MTNEYPIRVHTPHLPIEHIWRRSADLLGLVGDLYPRIYPYACQCGALRREDGTIVEPKTIRHE